MRASHVMTARTAWWHVRDGGKSRVAWRTAEVATVDVAVRSRGAVGAGEAEGFRVGMGVLVLSSPVTGSLTVPARACACISGEQLHVALQVQLGHEGWYTVRAAAGTPDAGAASAHRKSRQSGRA
jgi:hypothetical protein